MGRFVERIALGALGRQAAAAGSEDCKVVRVNDKPIALVRFGDQLDKKIRIRFNHLAAFVADQVTVGSMAKMVSSRPFAGMAVLDNADAFEFFNDPIDR